MPLVFSQNNDHYSPTFLLIKLVKLWPRTCVICLLLPFFLICFPFCLLVILPFLWAVFLWKMFQFLCPSPDRILFNFHVTTSSKTKRLASSSISKSCDDDDNDDDDKKNQFNELLAKSLEDKQVSVELDPSEIPSFYESDIEDEEKSKLGKKPAMSKICTRRLQEAPASCQFHLTSNSVRRKQPQSFYDVLSYWKSKEKGEK